MGVRQGRRGARRREEEKEGGGRRKGWVGGGLLARQRTRVTGGCCGQRRWLAGGSQAWASRLASSGHLPGGCQPLWCARQQHGGEVPVRVPVDSAKAKGVGRHQAEQPGVARIACECLPHSPCCRAAGRHHPATWSQRMVCTAQPRGWLLRTRAGAWMIGRPLDTPRTSGRQRCPCSGAKSS